MNDATKNPFEDRFVRMQYTVDYSEITLDVGEVGTI